MLLTCMLDMQQTALKHQESAGVVNNASRDALDQWEDYAWDGEDQTGNAGGGAALEWAPELELD